jgi:hypothetical protein
MALFYIRLRGKGNWKLRIFGLISGILVPKLLQRLRPAFPPRIGLRFKFKSVFILDISGFSVHYVYDHAFITRDRFVAYKWETAPRMPQRNMKVTQYLSLIFCYVLKPHDALTLL